ncbi:hypothetical protein BGZ76_000794 [Entomortierella beljakovae]|nr:hypothetical protein BGZ76_000794 [Entomortierella beljakovae]
MNGTSGSPGANGRHQPSNSPILVLEPVNDTFVLKSLELPQQSKVKIGRQTGVTTAPHPSNGYFDSKVLSRVHAEVWSESGKVYIRDLKSSNGTFLNGRRLCPENTESEPFELNQNDSLEFGIDIMDENGACNSHAKLKPSSPVGTGINPVKPNSVSIQGTQSENIDLIISRLQNELTRSQETYADLGFLKHSIGELERKIVSNGSEHDNKRDGPIHMNGHSNSLENSPINYADIINQKDKDHAAEILRLTRNFEDTKAQWEIQRAQELRSFQEENEALRKGQENANEALRQAAVKMDMIVARISAMDQEHTQELDAIQKKHSMDLENIDSKHKEEINRLVIEADAEQEGLSKKHSIELAEALALIDASTSVVSNLELTKLKSETQKLQETLDQQSQKMEMLVKEKSELEVLLEQTNSEVRALRQSTTALTKDSLRSRNSTGSGSSEMISNITNTPGEGPRQFSWSQFVFPVAKRSDSLMAQPSTILLSGGFMLVGLGVYAMWHKAGMTPS